jgi:hypothetical protein
MGLMFVSLQCSAPQPLHREFKVVGLQMPPAFDLGLMPVLEKAREVFPDESPVGGAFAGEFLVDVGVGHGYSEALCSTR